MPMAAARMTSWSAIDSVYGSRRLVGRAGTQTGRLDSARRLTAGRTPVEKGRSADYSVQSAVDDIGRVIDHAHPGSVRAFRPDVSRVGGRRDRDGRRQPRTQARRRGAGMPDRVRGWHRSPLGSDGGRKRTVRAAVAEAEELNERVSLFATPPTTTRRSSARPPTPLSLRSKMSSTGLPDGRPSERCDRRPVAMSPSGSRWRPGAAAAGYRAGCPAGRLRCRR